VVRIADRDFVLADIPGLIKGAHEGAGIGDRFLGHIERCAVNVHLIDATMENVVDDYHTIREELKAYGHGLAEKSEIVVLNKIDAISEEEVREKLARLRPLVGGELLAASSASHKGLDQVLFAVVRALEARKAQKQQQATPETEKIWTP